MSETTIEHDSVFERSRRGLIVSVNRVVDAVEAAGDVVSTVYTAIDQIVLQLRDELGITGGRLYEREGDEFVLRATFGDAKPVRPGLRVPNRYPPIARGLARGVLVMKAEDPRTDPELEACLGVEEFAVVELDGGRFVLGLDITPSVEHRDVVPTLGIVRRSINQILTSAHATAILAQARAIQQSILPQHAPTFPPFDIAGRSASLETVGGDLFDFIPVSENSLGCVVADVAGHGFPAALQVRDVYTGLRMGLGREYKMVHLLERLNRIIHQSTLTSRFVSLFYGELERTGVFIYVNGGHPPALHVKADGSVEKLERGGPVLGPLPNASYNRGFAQLRPGDMIVAYTDGVHEALGRPPGTSGPPRELGVDGLASFLPTCRGLAAEAVIDAIHDHATTWSAGAPATDDRTAVVITYPAQ